MIENLVNLDKKVFLALNHFASPGIDPVMRFLSGPVPWIVFILGFVWVLWRMPAKKNSTRYVIILGSLILAYAISEQTSVHLFKDTFMRLRPCHEPTLAGQVRLVANGCGGQYGFVSTHAANAFNVALLSALLLHEKWFTWFAFSWAILVSYSRIYVGVHYPGDILGGMVLGCIIALCVFGIARWIINRGIAKERRHATNIAT